MQYTSSSIKKAQTGTWEKKTICIENQERCEHLLAYNVNGSTNVHIKIGNSLFKFERLLSEKLKIGMPQDEHTILL